MFIACPHCRELVAPHPLTRQLPPTCPRCGGNLPNTRAGTAASARADSATDTAAAPSLVTLLRPAKADEQSATASAIADADIGTALASVEPEIAASAPATVHTDKLIQSPAIGSQTDPEAHAITPPQADIATGVDAQPAAASVSDVAAAAAASIPTDAASSAEPADAPPRAIATANAAKATGHPHSPSFLQRRRIAAPAPSPGRWQWAVIVALVAVLVLQVLLADRERLAADAGWRPLIGGLCGMLGCSMPAWREPQAMTMIDRDVRPLPDTPGVLLAKATFRNDARWAQPWPVVLLTLKDADGRSVGARALAPADYLDANAEAHIAAGQTAEITVRVREPSASVVAFAFDFH